MLKQYGYTPYDGPLAFTDEKQVRYTFKEGATLLLLEDLELESVFEMILKYKLSNKKVQMILTKVFETFVYLHDYFHIAHLFLTPDKIFYVKDSDPV